MTYDRDSGPLYEIVIGGWGNGKCCIRKGKQGHCYREYSGRVLSCSSYNYFWVSWGGNRIRLGRGTTYGSSTLMDFPDSSYRVNYLAVSTGWGATGYWEFSNPPVHGGWSSWGGYGSCSRNCGSGTQSRSRSCTNPRPSNGGRSCSGSSTSSRSCNTHSCAVNGGWSSWSGYGSCTRSCGSGTQSRSRSCTNPRPAHGGRSCSGSSSSSRSCNTHSCPVNGGWSSWSGYGSCTRSCGSGTQSRSRSCTNPRPAHGGRSCSGSTSSSRSCNTHNCPINGGWSSWSGYGSCTRSCGSGTQSRSRSCTNPRPAYGGTSCSGSTSSSRSCNTHNCPIHGGWSSWSGYGSCSKTCGTGSQSRSRSCTNPAPRYNGNSCSGSTTSSRNCNTHNCPIDGQWSAWSGYGACSLTCGTGKQSRTRTCTNPAPQYLGKACSGSASSSRDCNTHHCPIDGNWASWAAYRACTETCGGGIQTRSRTCTNPTPQHLGKACAGMSSHSRACNTHNCPIDGKWANWGNWGTCTVTCGGGSQSRSRTCTNPAPQYNGKACPNSATSTQSCNTHPCPIDGGFSNWGSWGVCTVTCGGGTQDRQRSCTNPAPQYGGAQCSGATTSTQDCNTQVCIIDGSWSNWSGFGDCSVSCGGGKQSRTRFCTNPKPANGGKNCPGSASDLADCNTAACPTVAPGTYQQLCPAGWFTCESGGITCIDNQFQCDCSKDCDDGSDEDVNYAGCQAAQMMECQSGGEHLRFSYLALVFVLLFTTLVQMML
ncbi:coadhesin-like [Saccostrea cucullata]|uniref:coadhesin-like n=1 Tax=Saccostrea cuccullata TaxID=36930 RepID=UPI002ED04890